MLVEVQSSGGEGTVGTAGALGGVDKGKHRAAGVRWRGGWETWWRCATRGWAAAVSGVFLRTRARHDRLKWAARLN